MKPIYLDNNATTPVAPEVFEAMRPFLTDSFGNPSSAYALGRQARKAIEAARENLAGLLGATSAGEIVFTSGGTESDNWAIRGALESDRRKKHIVTTRVEHEAVRRLCEKLETEGCEVSWLDVSNAGALDLDQLRDVVREDTAVVSVMAANNETGILFPVEEIARIVKERSDALFHVDGVNAAGKILCALRNTEIDLFSISGHKFHGPKGIGALYVRQGVSLPAFAIGGGQESGRRAGTEAVHQIVGLGAAAELVKDILPMRRIGALRDKLENEILDKIPNSRINGTRDADQRLPNTTNISFENLNGEMILAGLNDLNIFVSTGSACNAENHTASPVLQAMDVPFSQAMGSIRFSLGRYNNVSEIEFVLEKLPAVVKNLASLYF